jgi:hypothetical protein
MENEIAMQYLRDARKSLRKARKDMKKAGGVNWHSKVGKEAVAE